MSAANSETVGFVKRVGDLPVVQYLVVRSADAYGKVKEYNALVKFTLNAVERTLTVATETAKPVVAVFDVQLNTADSLACKGLDAVEGYAPILTKSTEEISEEAVKIYKNIVDPAIVKYQSVIKSGSEMVVAFKEYSRKKVVDFSETKYGQKVAIRFDAFLMSANTCVDNYLPAVTPDSCDTPDEPTMAVNDDSLAKAAFLATKLRRRVFVHAIIRYRAGKAQLIDILAKLGITVELYESVKAAATQNAEKATATLKTVGEKVKTLWKSYTSEDPDQDSTSSLAHKLLYMARCLSAQLVGTLQKMVAAAALLPSDIRPQLTATRQYVADLYAKMSKTTSLTEAADLLMQQVRDALAAMRGSIKELKEVKEEPELDTIEKETIQSEFTEVGDSVNFGG